MLNLPENPTISDLDAALRLIAIGAADCENSQLNAIKAMISLRLSQERNKNRLQNQAIDTEKFETI